MKLRKIGIFLMMLCMLLTIAACTEPVSEGDTTLKAQAEAMLDALIADDADAAYGLIYGAVSESEFQSVYAQMRQALSGVESYELRQLNWNVNTSNGVTSKSAQFIMTTNKETFLVEVHTSSRVQGLVGFHMNYYEEAVPSGGSLTTMAGADAVQWVFLIIGLAEIGLVIWAIVDCARSKIKRKGLWIVIILLAAITWTLTLTKSNLSFQFNIGMIFSHTALIRYGTGGFMLRLYLPIGMIVYWIMRKKLRADAAAAELAAVVNVYPQETVFTQPVTWQPYAQEQPAPQEEVEKPAQQEDEKDA